MLSFYEVSIHVLMFFIQKLCQEPDLTAAVLHEEARSKAFYTSLQTCIRTKNGFDQNCCGVARWHGCLWETRRVQQAVNIEQVLRLLRSRMDKALQVEEPQRKRGRKRQR